jgi:predicted DNA-binding protein
MSRHSGGLVRHIITFRINSEEKQILEQLAKKSGRTVSNYMRRKLQLIREPE